MKCENDRNSTIGEENGPLWRTNFNRIALNYVAEGWIGDLARHMYCRNGLKKRIQIISAHFKRINVNPSFIKLIGKFLRKGLIYLKHRTSIRTFKILKIIKTRSLLSFAVSKFKSNPMKFKIIKKKTPRKTSQHCSHYNSVWFVEWKLKARFMMWIFIIIVIYIMYIKAYSGYTYYSSCISLLQSVWMSPEDA